jgi:hypothetical protein
MITIHLVTVENYDKESEAREGFCGAITRDHYYYIGNRHGDTWNLAKIKDVLQTPGRGLCPLCEKSELVTLIELGMAEL